MLPEAISYKLLEEGVAGDDSAKLRIAKLYMDSAAANPQNYALARELLLQVKSDTTGHVELQLGMMSAAGLGVQKNEADANAHFRRAALQGKRAALVLLASSWLSNSNRSKLRSATIIFASAAKDPELGFGRRLIASTWWIEANIRRSWRKLLLR